MVTDDQEIVKTILFEQILEENGKFIYFRNSVGFKLVHVFG